VHRDALHRGLADPAEADGLGPPRADDLGG